MAIIKATNLVKVYNKNHVAVDSISFEIQPGRVFGFLGPNGAGKSTTIKMITGLLSPTSGEIEILDRSIDESPQEIQKLIGYIPQDLVFFDHLTVWENAVLFSKSYGISHMEERITEVFDLLGLNEIQDQQADRLSGGQKRRLNVALGLLHRPKILIMDEPSAGMDPQSRNILWETVDRLSDDDMTIILTTHLMEVAEQLADDICIIDHGKILVKGLLEEIKRDYGKTNMVELVVNEHIDKYDKNHLVDVLVKEFGDLVNQNGKIVIPTGEGISGIRQVMEIVEPIGLHHIDQIMARQNSLEDIFIELTGRELRD